MDSETNLIFEQYKQVNENIGLGPMIGSCINVPGPGSQSTGSKVVFNIVAPKHSRSKCENAENGCTCGNCPDCAKNIKKEEETVYIQAGDTSGDDCGCSECDDDYDGEVDMARAELLKAAEYATKLFNHLANIESLEGWTASKITKASDYLSSVYHALEYDALDANVEDEEDDIEIDEFDGDEVAKKTGFA